MMLKYRDANRKRCQEAGIASSTRLLTHCRELRTNPGVMLHGRIPDRTVPSMYNQEHRKASMKHTNELCHRSMSKIKVGKSLEL